MTNLFVQHFKITPNYPPQALPIVQVGGRHLCYLTPWRTQTQNTIEQYPTYIKYTMKLGKDWTLLFPDILIKRHNNSSIRTIIAYYITRCTGNPINTDLHTNSNNNPKQRHKNLPIQRQDHFHLDSLQSEMNQLHKVLQANGYPPSLKATPSDPKEKFQMITPQART